MITNETFFHHSLNLVDVSNQNDISIGNNTTFDDEKNPYHIVAYKRPRHKKNIKQFS